MTPQALRRSAETQLADYLETFPEEQTELAGLSAQLQDDPHDLFSRLNMRGHITTSGLVHDPVTDQVLVVHHRQYDRWLQPGGHQEGDGPLWTSALREVIEETGVRPHEGQILVGGFGRPLDIETHAIPANPLRGEGAHVHHDFIYLFLADSLEPLVPQLAEVKAAKWISSAQFSQLPGDRFARLVAKLRGRCPPATLLPLP